MGTMTGRVALITGGSAGIGRAGAIAFAREGANVVIADVDAGRGEKTAAELEAEGVCAMFVPADVSQPTHGDAAANEQLVQTEPVGRLGRPEEIADAVIWLCSERATFVTGQAIAVDGGFVAR